MATVLVPIKVYKINSNQLTGTYGVDIYFAGATLNVQPNTGTTLNDLRVGNVLIYSRVKSSATGNTVFFSTLTPAAIQTLTNA